MEILKVIEDMRIEMYRLANENGMTHPSVIEVSMKIDEKVNEYLRVKNK
jgi:hypothetical protein